MIDIDKIVEDICSYYCRNNDIDDRIFKKLLLEVIGYLATIDRSITPEISDVFYSTTFNETGSTAEGALKVIFLTDLPGATVDGNAILPGVPIVLEAVYDKATGRYEKLPSISYEATNGATLYIIQDLLFSVDVFDPASIKDSEGNSLLTQQLLTKEAPSISGTIQDEKTNNGSARDIQLGRAYTGDGVDDYIQLPFDLVASDTITKQGVGVITRDDVNNRLNISGQVWGIEIKDNLAITKAFYKCDEQTGTTAYDSSGNARNGTITNATLSTFHSTQNIYSYQNEVGYSKPATVFIPRNEAIPTQDVLGNPLEFSGQVPYNARLTQSNAVATNGTSQAILIPFLENPQEFSFFTHFTQGAFTGTWASNYDTNSNQRRWQIYSNGNPATASINMRFGNSNGAYLGQWSSTSTYNLNNYKSIGFRFSTSTLTLKVYLDGVEVPGTFSSTFAALKATSQPILLGARWNTFPAMTDYGAYTFWDTRFYESVLTEAQFLALHNYIEIIPQPSKKLPFSEGVGQSSYDTQNGNAATLINAPDRVKQNDYHYNLVNGFSRYAYLNDPIDSYVTFTQSLATATNATVRFKIQTRDSDGLVLRNLAGSSAYLMAWSGVLTPSSTTISANAGTPSYTIDGVLFTGTTRGQLHTIIADGNIHDVVITNANLSTWTGTMLGYFTDGNAFNLQGIVFDLSIEKVAGTFDHRYEGYGNTTADWVDKVGSANGTIIGTLTDIYIPAINSTTDAFNQLTKNPTGAYHNGAETLIDFRNNVNSPVAVINNWETAWAFNTARVNPEFKRTLTQDAIDHRSDRFLAYREALTGIDLAKVDKYVLTEEI